MALLTILMCFASTNVFAQLKEVRGVQTRMVEYQTDEYINRVGYTRHGFEFKNENNYSVWVETELYDSDGKIVDTKSFTLNAKESYVWKVGDKFLHIRILGSVDKEDQYDQYYVKYKAYKAE